MLSYFIKSSVLLLLFLAFYHLFLEREKMHQFNRFYLLFAICVSFVIPLITFTTIVPVIDDFSQNTVIEEIPFDASQIVINEEIKSTFNYYLLLPIAYALVSLIFMIRFSRNLWKLINKIRENKKINYNKANLVLVDDKILPHTFWNYIFINKDDYFNEKIEEELFTHELTHATQKHTFDVLLIEILQTVFWINPLFIFLKKAIQLNHEYLADESVVHTYKNTYQYQHLLVNKAAWKNEYYLASNLNYLVTKKRLKMMTVKSSPTKILMKKLAIIPLVAAFVFAFAERVEAQEIIIEEEKPIVTIVETVPFDANQKIEDSEIYKEYFYKSLRMSFKDKNGNTVSKSYNELTEEEKSKLAPPAPLKMKRKPISKKIFNQLKNKEKYAVWIDGKVIDNKTLNDYKSSDFANHFVSFVYKNARSKKFPQEYQANLYTEAHFKELNRRRVAKFLDYLKKEKNVVEIEEVVPVINETKNNPSPKKYTPTSNGSKQNIESLDYLKKYTKTELAEFEIELYKEKNQMYLTCKKGCAWKKLSFTLFENNNQIVDEFGMNKRTSSRGNFAFTVSYNAKEIQLKSDRATAWKTVSFNNDKRGKVNQFGVATILNVNQLKKAKETYLEKVKDTTNIKFNKGWYITIDDEKYYYTFNKNERIARYFKNGKLADLDIVKEYKKKHKKFEALKKSGKHYVFKNDKEKEIIKREFSDLGGMYFRMSRADKNKVQRPENPIRPYIKLMKNDVVYYKLRKDLTEEDKLLLPPPPPRKNATDEEKEKAKVEFENWKKRTGNTLNQIPPPPKRPTIEKDTIPKKKAKAKITLNNLNDLDEKSFVKALEELTEEEKKKNRKNVTYYLNGKVIKQKDLNNIKVNTIKSTQVVREKDGSKSVRIITKII